MITTIGCGGFLPRARQRIIPPVSAQIPFSSSCFLLLHLDWADEPDLNPSTALPACKRFLLFEAFLGNLHLRSILGTFFSSEGDVSVLVFLFSIKLNCMERKAEC